MSDAPPYPALAGAEDPLPGIDASVPSIACYITTDIT